MEPFLIRVFNNDAAWDRLEARGQKWFMLSNHDLARLHVATYEVKGDDVDVADVRRHAKKVAEMHPGCVLVHI